MNRPAATPLKSWRVVALALVLGGAALSAPPIAHALNGAVSAARAKTIWAEWKKKSSAVGTLPDRLPEPGQPAFWLRVPSCKLSVLTLVESDSDALHRFPAVRHIEMNDAIVASAHRDTHFRPLQRIRVGDVLTIESATGQIARYKVGTIRILLPEQVVAAVGDPECRGALHLLTCYPFRYFGAAPKRFLVTALPVK
jgi:LPXTG-site transpeptidase (sortase) family protein